MIPERGHLYAHGNSLIKTDMFCHLWNLSGDSVSLTLTNLCNKPTIIQVIFPVATTWNMQEIKSKLQLIKWNFNIEPLNKISKNSMNPMKKKFSY